MSAAAQNMQNILVIKLGALGDFVQALGPFAAIRHYHRDSRITLLTTQPFEGLAAQSGYFDDIWIDDRPALWRIGAIFDLRQRLRGGAFDRIYDLQTADRTNFYFRLLGRPKPEWSGIAPGCSHPDANPDRDALHTIERQRGQLKAAGIEDVPLSDLSWLPRGSEKFDLPQGFVLLVAGGSAHRQDKRWLATRYAQLARQLAATGRQPVLLGGGADRAATAEIAESCPGVIDLTGKTSLADIAALAGAAAGAVGNDCGPMHLIAASGCPSLVLFSHASDPALCAPRGADVAILRRASLEDLDVNAVEAALRLR
ncbi:MAG: glycosyltransferase family 9 protein [Alphaproteobacteria bacterium]